ncbi:histidine phosphatase family protein [Cohnella terricola]|uniref:histidine phosphatase family protein n=1 Tax=Cohnella terricola TaxID=1289167 RepID=UPI0016464708|nr:histidine phosphatase family protein [Cohnella terricola]
MTIFYLIRHGEPDWGLKDKRNLQGALRDFVPLTENGINQAEQVVEKNLFLSQCDLIVSSPFTRSLQTAAIINRNLGLPLRVEFDLHEWTPDNWQATSVEEITELWIDYMKHNGSYPEGESKLWETKESLLERTRKVLHKYLDKSKVIVVCHGMVIATLMELISDEIQLCGVYEYKALMNR